MNVIIRICFAFCLCDAWKTSAEHTSHPCSNFVELSYGLRRAPNIHADMFPLCDKWLKPKWYRVKYSTMAKAEPTINHCGTTFPIWLQGEDPMHPNIEEHLTACQVQFSGPCAYTYNITALRCPNNDVLYFLNGSNICNAAYCFELIDDCVKETVSEVEVAYYNTTWERKQSHNNEEYYDPIVNFFCKFKPLGKDSVFYNIEWFIDDMPVKNFTVDKSSADEAIFSSSDMLNMNKKVGDQILCTVGVISSPNSSVCTRQISMPFTVGFEILNTTVDIQRNGTEKILIKQNIPYVARTYPSKQESSILNINTIYKDADKLACQQIGNHKECSLDINALDYNSVNQLKPKEAWEKIYEIVISSLDPGEYYLQQYRLLMSLGTNTQKDNVFFNDAELSDIHINIVENINEWKGKRCSSYADPHMTTFDGFNYECHKDGCLSGKTYVLYRNRNHVQEAQVRHGSCWGDPRCICAVAAQAGQDVFVIDFCSGRELIDFLTCNDKSLQVYKDGDLIYRIVFPTGTSLKAYLYESWDANTGRFWFINVDVFPTIADYESTEGLCGYLDGNQTNDLTRRDMTVDNIQLFDYYNVHPNQFSDSWSLSESGSEDLLSYNHNIYGNLRNLSTLTQKLCHCNENGTFCSYRHHQNCKTATWGTKYACVLQASRRKKRDIILSQHAHSRDKIYNLSQREKREATHSQDEATSLCQFAFQKSAHFETCLNNIPNFGNDTLINCINDLMMTGNENLTQLHVETALAQCKEYISYNSSLQTEQPMLSYTILNLCPKNCSNNGVCNEGKCTCIKGYGGSDCSFDISSPPVISQISDNGLCDKSTDPCDEITIYGKYFVSNPNASCFLERNEYNTSGMSFNEEMYQIHLREKTLFEASCSLVFDASDSWFSKFVFNLTNDGERFTEEYIMYVYQSECQIYKNESGTISFSLQESYCFIEGVCVSEGKLKSPSSCLLCDPQKDAYNWVYGSSTRLRKLLIDIPSYCTISDTDQTETNDMQIIAIVGGCIGFIVVLFIVVLITVVVKQKVTKRDTYTLSNPNEAVFNVYPDRQTVLKHTFDPRTNLFSCSSPEENDSKQSAATHPQKGSESMDLSQMY